MHTHRITRTLAALVVAGALVSCAADAEPRGLDDRDRKGKAAREKRADGKSGKDRPGDRQAAGGARPGAAKPGSGSDGGAEAATSGGGSNSGSPGSGSGSSTSGNEPPAQPSCLEDAAGDTDGSGSRPAYADLSGGCLRPTGAQLALEATVAGPIPGSMPDRNTQASYGFELEPPDGPEIYVYAEAGPGGWTAHLTRGGNQREIAAPDISGDRLTMTIPAAELGRGGTVQWLVESSWLKSGVLTTSYAFDTAPNAGTARFDRR